jgi:cation:H+ antiporter
VSPPLSLVLFLGGLAALFFGAELLVGGAVRIAAALGVSSLVVGLTLVSFGTSAPELVVSGLASFRGSGGLAVGNVLGSNIANLALILGVSALLFPIAVGRELIARDVPVMVALSLLVPLLGSSGSLSRVAGLLLVVLFLLYIGYLAALTRRQAGSVLRLIEHEEPMGERGGAPWRDLATSAAGLLLLAVGAHLLVSTSRELAVTLGVSEVVIGLTLVAFGTSLPELATSISASRRGHGGIVIGNIVGSNIFNVSLILGFAALVRPLPMSATVLRVDVPIVIGLSLAILPVVFSGRRVDRWEGGVLFATYIGFILWRIS